VGCSKITKSYLLFLFNVFIACKITSCVDASSVAKWTGLLIIFAPLSFEIFKISLSSDDTKTSSIIFDNMPALIE